LNFKTLNLSKLSVHCTPPDATFGISVLSPDCIFVFCRNFRKKKSNDFFVEYKVTGYSNKDEVLIAPRAWSLNTNPF